MKGFDQYVDREATWVKHKVLSLYLEKLAYKIGSWSSTLTYVDGFAGPWMETTDDLSDTSPYIAIEELRKAGGGLKKANLRVPTVRCLFIEKDVAAYQKLRNFLTTVHDIQTKAINGEFEQNVAEVIRFIGNSFALFFIDPTGWTGFGIKAIAPVLKHEPGETLINFMTKDIIRFVDVEDSSTRATFIDLFGDADYQQRWRGLSKAEREVAIVDTYSERVKDAGNFKYVVNTIVLHPQTQRTHFHLIYATRHIDGLRTFRKVEREAMGQQGLIRATAQERKRIERTQQPKLLEVTEASRIDYFNELRSKYHQAAKQKIRMMLEVEGRVRYDVLEEAAMLEPLTSSSDLDDWLAEWAKQRVIRLEGLKPRERKPKPDEGHYVVWTGTEQMGF